MTNAAIIAIVIAFSLAVAAIIVRLAPKGPQSSEEYILYTLRRNARVGLIVAPVLIVMAIVAHFFL